MSDMWQTATYTLKHLKENKDANKKHLAPEWLIWLSTYLWFRS